MLREEEHLLDEVGDVFALEAVLHRGAVPASADDPSGTHLRQVLGNSRGRALERGGEVTHDHRALQQQPGHPQTGRISQKLEHLRGGDGEVTPTSKLHICAHTYMLHNMHSDAQQNTHDHDHGAHGNGEHAHDHGGVWGRIRHVLIPHSHDAADSIDDTLEATGQGIRAVKISLLALGATALTQSIIVWFSGSVALAADTIHNFSDALTAIPLWIAFVLSRRAATRSFTHGYGRVEDLAGLFIVAMIALSAVVAGWEAIKRLMNPAPIEHLGWVAAAGVVGFLGNEAVALYRIRTGQRIGSAALVADGLHARADGLTSLAVVLGALGVAAGWPLADPIVGLLIALSILGILVVAGRDIFRRLLDATDPHLAETALHALNHVDGIDTVRDVRLRWVGHTLNVDADITVAPTLDIHAATELTATAEASLQHHLPRTGHIRVRATT